MADRTIKELQYMQAMPLNIKIALTKSRIREWINEYGEDGVSVSFSGGKDSTVLLDIVRQDYPSVTAMFVDVPTQYPELKQFVQTFDNVDIIKPSKNFFQVCEQYGFPLISKEVSDRVYYTRKYIAKTLNGEKGCEWAVGRMLGRDVDFDITKEELDQMLSMHSDANSRAKCLWETLENKTKGVATGEASKMYDLSKYKFLATAPFSCSAECCKVMKKRPAHDYAKKTGRVPMTAQMASESRLRTTQWLKNGCNGFNMKCPISNPMSFWTEQDILLYIKIKNLPICSVYGEVVEDVSKTDNLKGQMNIFDFQQACTIEHFDDDVPPLTTTGCKRTGCVLCAFGAHLEREGEGRFQMLKQTHPQWYKMLDIAKNNGVTYREAIEWVNKNSNINIPL